MHTERGWDKKGVLDSHEQSVKDYFGEKNAGEIEGQIKQKLSESVNQEVVVAEFGSGAGNTLSEFKENYPKITAIGFDLFPSKDNTEITQIKTDVELLPVKNNSVDIGFSVQVYRYIYDKLKFFKEVFDSLKPGGVAYIDIGQTMQGTEPPLNEIIYTLNLQKYFQIQYIRDKNNYNQFIMKIVKPQKDIKIDWRLQLKGVQKLIGSDSLPIIDSYYEKK